jgi:hypothetical protein
MRVSIGLGLIGLVGLVACGTSSDGTAASVNHDPSPSGPIGSSTDPTEPAGEPPSNVPPAPPPPDSPALPPGPLVRGLTISDVAVFQAVKVPVVKAGTLVAKTTRVAPVVAKRQGMIRVYVTPESGWTPHAVTAELRLVAGETSFPVVHDTKMISAASKEEDPTSTFNLEVPGESLPPGVEFKVSLTSPDGDDPTTSENKDARYPRDGRTEDLGAEMSGKLRVVIVPVKYDADGSGRVPPLGEAQLAMYKKTLMRVYPTSEVEVTAHAPYAFDSTISSNGGGFASVLRAMTDLRQKDNVEKDVYYYGLLAPKASMQAYCGNGCVTGLSGVVDNPDTAAMRASVGIGFDAQVSANTMAHELGHAHGRNHAPCGGPAGPDPKFPYQGGGIGVWGYDIFAKTYISPSKGKDMMGYCPNEWVSDYTYNALFNRIAAISVEKNISKPNAIALAAPKRAARYRVATVGESGDLAWDGNLDLNDENDLRGSITRQAAFLSESGAQMVTRTAKFVPFDHLPGGFVFVPQEHEIDLTNWKAVSVEGFAHALSR